MLAVPEKVVSITDFRAKISEYAGLIAGGESFLVTRYNKAIFRVDPIRQNGSAPRCKGILAKDADPSKIPFEEEAWSRAVLGRTGVLPENKSMKTQNSERECV